MHSPKNVPEFLHTDTTIEMAYALRARINTSHFETEVITRYFNVNSADTVTLIFLVGELVLCTP